MCNYNETQPSWNETFISWARYQHGLQNIGCCYYRMVTNEILPVHGDDYKLYREKFKVELDDCYRILVFLEDWKSGHYFEVDGKNITDYKAGDYAIWSGDEEHMASNIGTEYRYTLQITGRIDE